MRKKLNEIYWVQFNVVYFPWNFIAQEVRFLLLLKHPLIQTSGFYFSHMPWFKDFKQRKCIAIQLNWFKMTEPRWRICGFIRMISSLFHYFCQRYEVQVKLYLDTENSNIILGKFSGCIRRSLKIMERGSDAPRP